VNESSTAGVLAQTTDGSEKRRGSRLMIEVPITVMGMDPLGEPFKESTVTIGISCYGCKYRTKRYAAKDSTVTLEIPQPQSPRGSRIAHARVVWVQRPRHHRESFQIGLELEVPGNVWGIDSPPADWFPLPGDVPVPEPAIKEPAPPLEESRSKPAVAEVMPPEPAPLLGSPPAAAPIVSKVGEWETLHLPERDAHASQAALTEQARELVAQTVKRTTDAMIAEEIALMQKHFTGRLETALVDTLKSFSELTGEIINQTRESCFASARQMTGEMTRQLAKQTAAQMAEQLAQRIEAALQRIADESRQQRSAQLRAPQQSAPPAEAEETAEAAPISATPARKAPAKRRKKAPKAEP
jgi:hypothetical protein